MTRSMSDAQMLAKYGYDKEPWEQSDGQRFSYAQVSQGHGYPVSLNPRPERIPSIDQYPLIRNDGARVSEYGAREWRYNFPEFTYTFKPRTQAELQALEVPQKEHVRPEVNQILSAFRGSTMQDFATWSWGFGTYDTFGGYTTWNNPGSEFHCFTLTTPEQVDAARRILSRLRNVMEASNV